MALPGVAKGGESNVATDTSRPLNFNVNLVEQLLQSQKKTARRVVAHTAFGMSSEKLCGRGGSKRYRRPPRR